MFTWPPKTCPNCKLDVELCQGCYGTGRIYAQIQVEVDHKSKDWVPCPQCNGLGLKEAVGTPSKEK
jgi:DnaJ-class molecular chaperone